ncbi:hypothetical protein VSS74_09535 [Conexibacter stalactiti]|uniref:CHRD domain-containing protein n=1 Tax=Conexibacter stalactiti TaxID=1940611 RepID=A0ABU4HMN9_9ACTN|nr:hypothetical protein [Conexibacter stalactiti]MDW5594578.1 hypothetical protein [Conexibacter stalactiti]MEC5035220.1 hypothetical protein [Conexibacter stalactiti]
MLPRLLLAAGALTLAAPATALADATLTAGPLKVRDYQLTLVATDAAKDSLSVMLSRRSGASTQLHMYGFASGVTVKAAGAKPTISAKLGRYGSVKLTLGTLKSGRGSVPAGCTGSGGRNDRGSFSGALQLKLDTTYFKTVKASSLPGARVSGGALRCDGGTGGQTSGLTLMAMPESGDGNTFMVNATRTAGGGVTQSAMRSDAAAATAPATVMHMITATSAASTFTTAADLSSATLTGPAPFLSGALAFAGEATGTMASGTVSGDWAAKFDSIGTQRLAAGTTATLMQR